MALLLLAGCQVPPASSERNSPPSLASTSAYARFGFARDTLTPTLPIGAPSGRPRRDVSGVQVVPPSVDLNSPLPGPPSTCCQNLPWTCHIPAYSTFGSAGSMARSTAPV